MGSQKIFLGIPVLNRIDLLERCLEHVDHPAEILIVNNNWHDPAFNAALRALAERRGLEVRSRERNLGVAASWNLILRAGLGRGYDRIYLGSNDTFLHPGSLRAVEEMERWPDAGLWHLQHWNFFAVEAWVIPRVGWFDENFYPAYKEDQDYRYRCGLAGVRRVKHELPAGVGGEHLGSQTILSDAEYAGRNRETHLGWNAGYYFAKWGGEADSEVHRSPFGRPDRDWRWWPPPGESIALRDWDRGRHRRKNAGEL